MIDPIYRFCVRVAPNPDMQQLVPEAIQGACSRCRHRVWVNAAQEIPEFIATSRRPFIPICVECCLADPEIRPEVMKMLLPALHDYQAGVPASAWKDGERWDGTESEQDIPIGDDSELA